MSDFETVITCASGRAWGASLTNANGEWTNLHLVRLGDDGEPFQPGPGKHFAEKRSLWVGFNGQRFCRKAGSRWAEENEPDLLDQLGAYLKQHHA